MQRNISGAAADVPPQRPPLQLGIATTTISSQGNVGVGLANTIAASGTIHSSLFITNGMGNLALGLTLSQSGTLSVQRYIDGAGNVPMGAAVTQALTAGTNGVLLSNDDKPFRTAKIAVVNDGTVTATIT